MQESTIVLATRNAGKIREMRAILADLPVRVESLAEHPQVPEVEETGATFAEKAELKARAVAAATGRVAVADDSGLVVDALDGAPGVYSSRFAGPDASDEEKNEKVLALMRDVPEEQRTARFVAAIAVARPDGTVRTVTGACEGSIAHAPRGEQGFGYDPIFRVAGTGRTMAELPAVEKNRISHRAHALAQARDVLCEWLKT